MKKYQNIPTCDATIKENIEEKEQYSITTKEETTRTKKK